jgi:hypothetical protein
VREYLDIAQLATATPWTADAIEKMVRRRVLTLGVHYFQPFGPRTKLLFKWSAIVRLIEDGGARLVSAPDTLGGGRSTPRRRIDVEKATTGLHRLLG